MQKEAPVCEALVEYRLVCSGTLFPDPFVGDWSRSDRARILLEEPFGLLVASQPFEEYPQELVLRFSVATVSEQDGSVSRSYLPDEAIASDIAALLTLLCRRLIMVSVRVRRQFQNPGPPGPFPPAPAILLDYPSPLVTTIKRTHWVERPIEFLYGLDGVQVKSHQPRARAFDYQWISNVLAKLSILPAAEAIMRAARLYTLAMEIVEQQHEICYQLLISAVETIAGEIDLKWKPEPSDMLELASSRALISAAKSEGVAEDVAKRIALEASRDYAWTGRRFREFILENVNSQDLSSDDDLFCVPNWLCPKPAQFRKALTEVYKVRGGATHGGRAYPATACIGPSHLIPAEALGAILNPGPAFPPVGWFERVVNGAICGYLRSQVPILNSSEDAPGDAL